MPPETELVRQWLDRAIADLRAARAILSTEPPLTEEACFHAQQAVEKALKAYLVHLRIEFQWSHQISYLLDLICERDRSFGELRESAVPLTDYAVRFRYPHPGPVPTVEAAREAMETAEHVRRFVLDRVPPEVRRTGDVGR
jgi:HEPN domain-containing protein